MHINHIKEKNNKNKFFAIKLNIICRLFDFCKFYKVDISKIIKNLDYKEE